MPKVSFMQPIIFVDLDGVLVNLVAGLSKVVGEEIESANSDTFKKHYYKLVESLNHDDLVNFWTHLPPTDDCMTIWNSLKHLQPLILTAVTDSMASCEGKKNWVEKHLKIPRDRVFCACKSREKQKYASINSILIDDYDKNIEEFKNKGGHGILHTRTKKTLKELQKILNQWDLKLNRS